ncbi:hypothetical protein [Actinospica robiniae]|uniref:hypothetical protein n=1 Tax=Actinospica robiniae TaxID=304901 RepID=UPI0003F66C58|nr:hypothetical protein [Actinospica robiniae]
MTENTTTTDGTEAEEAELVESKSASEALPDELVEIDESESETEFVALGQPRAADDLPEELIEIDEVDAEEDVPGSGAVSGGFGFAGIVLGLVSLSTNWTSSVISERANDNGQIHSTATTQAQANQLGVTLAHQGWHTQAVWALAFAVGAMLFGAGSLLSPSLLLSGKQPAWAKAVSLGAVIVGVIGVVLAVLTLTNVFGGAITVPPTPAS